MDNTVRGRYAPSPTGRMHLGNIYCALVSWLSAKGRGGRWVLRIEDLDESRCRREYADQLMRDLETLGLEWDEGPFYQSGRHSYYEDALARLTERGATYPCWCTRAELNASSAPHESDGRRIYPGTCRDNSVRAAQCQGKPYALRLKVPDAEISFEDRHYGRFSVNLARECGDFVLQRSDGAWAYQLAVVVDDALMGITEVVRGRDLLLSAAQQIYLYGLLGCQAPSFAHIPLICNSEGQRLCKRDFSMDMAAMSARMSSEEIIGLAASCAGLKVGACKPRELLGLFDFEKLPAGDILL